MDQTALSAVQRSKASETVHVEIRLPHTGIAVDIPKEKIAAPPAVPTHNFVPSLSSAVSVLVQFFVFVPVAESLCNVCG